MEEMDMLDAERREVREEERETPFPSCFPFVCSRLAWGREEGRG